MRRALLPAACALVQLVSLTTGPAHTYPAWAALVSAILGIASGLSILVRNRLPDFVLGFTVLTYVIQVSVGGPVLPLAIAVSAFVIGRRGASAGTQERSISWTVASLTFALAGVALACAASGHPYLGGPFGLLVLGAGLVGMLLAVRTARELRRSDELVAAERLRIARDLHDVVGHGLGAITVQAGAARMALANGATSEATQAMLTVETAGRAVLREVRWLLGLLREDSEHPALRDVPALVGNARRCGMAVSLSVTGDLDAAPSAQGEAAYRVIQEALTNTLRHADGGEAHVDIELGPELSVRVSDDGTDTSTSGSGAETLMGNGIRGIHERVQALGGTVRTGPVAGSGWVVHARLPLGRVR